VIAYQTNCLARVHLLNFKSQVRTLHDPAPRSTSSAATGGQVESAKWFRGSELGISFNLSTNPRKPTVDGGAGQAPLPVKRRTSAGGLGWVSNLETKKFVRNQTASFLSADGMTLEDRSA
jgi:hypothetical protein